MKIRTSQIVLDHYEYGVVPKNVRVWYEVWENMFNSEINEFYYYQFEPVCLRYALKQIVNKIELTIDRDYEFSKVKNELIEKINYSIKVDYISKEIYLNEINKLKELIGKSSQKKPLVSEVICLCHYILDNINTGTIFNKVFNELKITLFEKNDCNIRQLQVLSQLLVIELVEKGFNFYRIERLLNNIFSPNFHVLCNEHYSSKYIGTNVSYTVNNDSTIEERYSFITSLYNAPTFNCKIVFLILGAKAKDIQKLKFENILFQTRLDIEGEDDQENGKIFVFDFAEKDFENKPFLRATIETNGVDFFEMEGNAREYLYNIIEFLKYDHAYSDDIKLKISLAWVVLDSSNKIIYQVANPFESTGKIPPRYEDFEMLDLYNKSVKMVTNQGLRYGLNSEILTNNKIFIILEWIKKAENNFDHAENYFTSLWFAFEHLVRNNEQRIIDTIHSYLPALFANNFLLEITDKLHDIHRAKTMGRIMNVEDTQLGIDCGLIPISNNTFRFDPFKYGYNLNELLKYIDEDYLYLKTNDISSLYENKVLLTVTLKSIYERVRYEFNIMNKIRNDIVHSGETKIEFLGYFCNRLKHSIDLILSKVVLELKYHPHRTIHEILASQQFIYELLLQRIEQNEKLKYNFFR
jgi:hypothetical protein